MLCILLLLLFYRNFHNGILSYFWSFWALFLYLGYLFENVFQMGLFLVYVACFVVCFFDVVVRVFHSFSTSLSDVESLSRFFCICSAFSDISIACSPTVSRFRFMASVAGEASSTPSFAASATSVISHSVRYWYTASDGMNPKAKFVVPSWGFT